MEIEKDRLDSFDRKLLDLLQVDARRPMAALADAVGLSVPACYRRIRRLREAGIIEREIAIVRPKTLGWPLSMIVLVTLERETSRAIGELTAVFRRQPEILEAWNVTGGHAFAVRIIVRDMAHYDDLTQRLFSDDDRIRSFETLVVIRDIKPLSPVPAGRG